MRINILFGKGKIELDIPDKNIIDVVTTDSQSINIKEDKVMADALNNPIESKKVIRDCKR